MPVPSAVRTALAILRTHEAMAGCPTSGGSVVETIQRVVDTFEETRTRWVLVGAHAIGMLTEPRTTADFDFVVETRKFGPVLRALGEKFDDLGRRDIGPAVRLTAIDVDLIRASQHPIFEEALKSAVEVETWKIPRTEVVIALKWLAASSRTRPPDRRLRDAADLLAVYEAHRENLDMRFVMDLVAKVHGGADDELRDMIDRADRGDQIIL